MKRSFVSSSRPCLSPSRSPGRVSESRATRRLCNPSRLRAESICIKPRIAKTKLDDREGEPRGSFGSESMHRFSLLNICRFLGLVVAKHAAQPWRYLKSGVLVIAAWSVTIQAQHPAQHHLRYGWTMSAWHVSPYHWNRWMASSESLLSSFAGRIHIKYIRIFGWSSFSYISVPPSRYLYCQSFIGRSPLHEDLLEENGEEMNWGLLWIKFILLRRRTAVSWLKLSCWGADESTCLIQFSF